jgi:ParB-like chromosome segregation protein Spo0J
MKNQSKPDFIQVKTSDLIPYARNARTHSDQQVSQIAASMIEFGFINPVIIDAENGIIAGHGRILAAQKLKIKTVPCIRVEYLTPTQKRAYILADNKLAGNAGWDNELLQIEITALQEDKFDPLITGFSGDEIKAILCGVEFTPDLPDDEEGEDKDRKYQITVTLENSEAQESLFRELNAKGFKVKAS